MALWKAWSSNIERRAHGRRRSAIPKKRPSLRAVAQLQASHLVSMQSGFAADQAKVIACRMSSAWAVDHVGARHLSRCAASISAAADSHVLHCVVLEMPGLETKQIATRAEAMMTSGALLVAVADLAASAPVARH